MKTSGLSGAAVGLSGAAFLAFFVFGFIDVLKGSAVPDIIARLGIGYAASGALLGSTYAGFFAGTAGSVLLLKKYAAPYLLLAAVVIVCLGTFLFGIMNSFIGLLAASLVIGFGCGLTDVTANLTVRLASDPAVLGSRLNRLSFFHGFGAIISPVFAGAVLLSSGGYPEMYLWAGAAALTIALAVVFLISRWRSADSPAEVEDGRTVWKPRVYLLAGVLFFYMTIEAGIAGWVVEYGKNVLALDTGTAVFALSLFFILLTAGRFLSSFYADRIGLLNTVRINMALVFLLLLAGIWVKGLHLLIPVSGLCMAAVFPTTSALLCTELEGGNTRLMGVFFSIAGIGGIVGPWMIGSLGRSISLAAGFSLLIIFAACGLMITEIYRRSTVYKRIAG